MLENLKNYQIILASNSPRRKELLTGLGIDYKVKVMKDVDESYPSSLCGEEIPLYIARQKAQAYLSEMQANELVITADTIVWLEHKVLGKPADKSEARAMLKMLSGRSHQVMTGVVLTTTAQQRCLVAVSKVTFSSLSDEEIEYYIEKFQPMDKAGAYGIQEWIGYIGVESIEGSYFNVMGLPVQRLYQELKQI